MKNNIYSILYSPLLLFIIYNIYYINIGISGKNRLFSALYKTLIGIATLAMPKNRTIHQQTDGAPRTIRNTTANPPIYSHYAQQLTTTPPAAEPPNGEPQTKKHTEIYFA